MLPIVDFRTRHDELPHIFGRRSVFSDDIDAAVQSILRAVRTGGDVALLELTERFDGVRLESLRVTPQRIRAAYEQMPSALRDVISEATANVRRFHEKEVRRSWFSEEDDGVVLGQRIVPIDRAGVYVPGGTAAYPSSVLMNVIPAQVAGVREIHLVSPPGSNGAPHPHVLAAAHFLGVEHVFAVGGAQAVAALAFGTETIAAVDKIVGPGNAYVAAAKKHVYGHVDIDSIAGPSEVVVLTDGSVPAHYAAADLLAQAEHDARASAVLVTHSREFAERVRESVREQIEDLPRKDIALRSLIDYGACIVTETLEQGIDVVNDLAPEHLELLLPEPASVLTRIRHAGAVFLGAYSPEPVGDYFAGPNHVLPTGGTARYASALGVDDFIRKQSVIAYTRGRLRRTGPRIASFARAEELEGHARSVEARLGEHPSTE